MRRNKSKNSKPSKDETPKGVRQIVGLHSCLEVLKVRPKSIVKIFIKEANQEKEDFAPFYDFAKKNKLEVVIKKPSFFDNISQVNQGICLLSDEEPDIDYSSGLCQLVLDGVEDPQNLGAIMRTSWLMGVKNIMLPGNRSSFLTPTVLKVASGGGEHVALDSDGHLASRVKALKEDGYWVYGLSHKATKNLWEVEFPEKTIFVAGSEAKGISQPVENQCDELLSIPQVDGEQSYNVSVAVGMFLSELKRQYSRNQ